MESQPAPRALARRGNHAVSQINVDLVNRHLMLQEGVSDHDAVGSSVDSAELSMDEIGTLG